ncbi:HlyD family efflux transporter periplasmic adaptor subunit [Sphingomonas sp. GlSt437]|uniref:HlyD family efflux transporter periplasmic adaptor subunit n=1 Tax=Sphingomonas sp. GlSt437 TaxID=3389970 RepID=UPI003A86F3CB
MTDTTAATGAETAAGAPSAAAAPATNERRRRLLTILGVVVIVGALVYLLWWLLVGSHRATTDDAYVGGDSAQITPLVSAPVKAVLKTDTDAVKAGEPLIVLDDSDARITLAQASAELDRSARRVRSYGATDASLGAQVDARAADVDRARTQVVQAQSALAKAQSDLAHRNALIDKGAVAGEEVTTARNAEVTARANLDAARAGLDQAIANENAARASLAANKTLTEGTAAASNPEVASSRAKRDQAALDLSRTVLRAPFDGVVAKRQVQVGQRVAAGTQLMTVVPVKHLYVDANFKEGQLRRIRIGQAATLTSDTYGGGVVYHGRVIGIGAGTGSAFALIPAQNATGNWIKVVQRVPVRIALDAGELAQHPLAIGASMNAEVTLD